TFRQFLAPELCSFAEEIGGALRIGFWEGVLDSSSSSSAWSSGSIMRNRCDVLDSSDSESGSSQHSDCCLRSRSRCSCLVSARCSDSYVERGYSSVLGNPCGCSCSLHGCIR